MNKQKAIGKKRARRRFHNRKKVRGSVERPRLCIQRTLKNMNCQVIDDSTGKTVASASTMEKDVRSSVSYGGNKDAAAAIGKLIAERAIAAGVSAVKFDRGHNKYHGRVAAMADAAREAGLKL